MTSATKYTILVRFFMWEKRFLTARGMHNQFNVVPAASSTVSGYANTCCRVGTKSFRGGKCPPLP